MTHGKDPLLGGGGGVLYGRKKKEEGGGLWSKNGAKTKTVSFNIYSHAASERGRNSKWVTVSQDSRKNRERKQRAPERGRRKNWERVSGGLEPANYSQDWNVPQQICSERKRRRAYQISWEMFYYESDWQKITNSCLHGRVSSCVTKSWCDPEKCKPQCSLQYSTEGRVSVSISPF